MHVVRKLDAGDVILARSIPIAPDETGGSLHDRLAELAPAVLAEALEKLADGTAARIPQDDAASSYVSKLERDDGRLDWSQDAAALERRIRAYDPWPGTFTLTTEDGRPKRLKIFPPVTVLDMDLSPGEISTADGRFIIGCGSGALRLETVQPEGGRRMSAADYLRGRMPVVVRNLTYLAWRCGPLRRVCRDHPSSVSPRLPSRASHSGHCSTALPISASPDVLVTCHSSSVSSNLRFRHSISLSWIFPRSKIRLSPGFMAGTLSGGSDSLTIISCSSLARLTSTSPESSDSPTGAWLVFEISTRRVMVLLPGVALSVRACRGRIPGSGA